jgi:hypothetical protein
MGMCSILPDSVILPTPSSCFYCASRTDRCWIAIRFLPTSKSELLPIWRRRAVLRISELGNTPSRILLCCRYTDGFDKVAEPGKRYPFTHYRVDSPCTLHGSAETCFLVFALRRARSQAENAGKCGKLLNIPMKPISEEQKVLPDIARTYRE